ncbi:hypothetical protein EAF04_004324 [Stromatinia cepivora]|nr:hypothetical protein EAF04_004324 [Stromatinia cepivora]
MYSIILFLKLYNPKIYTTKYINILFKESILDKSLFRNNRIMKSFEKVKKETKYSSTQITKSFRTAILYLILVLIYKYMKGYDQRIYIGNVFRIDNKNKVYITFKRKYNRYQIIIIRIRIANVILSLFDINRNSSTITRAHIRNLLSVILNFSYDILEDSSDNINKSSLFEIQENFLLEMNKNFDANSLLYPYISYPYQTKPFTSKQTLKVYMKTHNKPNRDHLFYSRSGYKLHRHIYPFKTR